jgi:hypothetical protein
MTGTKRRSTARAKKPPQSAASQAELCRKLLAMRSSIHVLFQGPTDDGIGLLPNSAKRFASLLLKTIETILEECDACDKAAHLPGPPRPSGLMPDSIDCLNALAELAAGKPFAAILEDGIFEILTNGRLFDPVGHSQLNAATRRELLFKIRHADAIVRTGLGALREMLPFFETHAILFEPSLSRLNPLLVELAEPSENFHLANPDELNDRMLETLRTCATGRDRFASGRTFRYINGEFAAADLRSIRTPREFYGYTLTREQFQSFYSRFASGAGNHPLLISSLPGLGKTHFSISFALSHPNLTLVLPQPRDLEEGLEPLIRELAWRKNRKFVVFFDDVDTRNINWYYFRTHVGGSFVLPPNMTIVIASNFEFPANISSRGQGLTFPMFDEITCQEMVQDFLAAFGMKKPKSELILSIASNYVEEFGQKVFEELSPRTLVRYLERYNHDMKKRMRMLELSRGDVVSKPDPRIFLEVNVRLLRSLYGEEAIDRLRREKYDIYDDDVKT